MSCDGGRHAFTGSRKPLREFHMLQNMFKGLHVSHGNGGVIFCPGPFPPLNCGRFRICYASAMPRDDLFSTPVENQPPEASTSVEQNFRSRPLAARMRPRSLDEFAGQTHILAPDQLLRRAI